MSFDAIIILGGGRTNEGNLTTLSTQRLDAGAALFREGVASQVFAMGGHYSTYSPHAIYFDQSGADLRTEYLVTQGIPLEAIVQVENGRDTIGEAFSARAVARELGIKEIALVTSDKHMERSLYIFRRIFGNNFTIVGVGVPCGDLLNEDEEKEYLGVVQRFFEQFPEEILDPNLDTWFTDHADLYAAYKSIHDVYHPPGNESQAYSGVKRERN